MSVTIHDGIWKNLKRDWRDRKGESKERVGFYSFDWANSCYATVAITLYIPILLVNLAQAYININPCASDVICDAIGCNSTVECSSCVIGQGTQIWNPLTSAFEDTSGQTLPWGGQDISAFGFASYVLSLSAGAQAVAFITFGAYADYGRSKMKFLVGSTLLGCIPTILFIICSSPDSYVLASILVIISNVGFGIANVYYYAYLPILTERHVDVVTAKENNANSEELRDVLEKVSNFMSITGFSAGYFAGLVTTIISFGFTLGIGSTIDNGFLSDRVNLVFVGVWWLLWTIWIFRTVKDDEGKSRRDAKGPFIFLGWTETYHLLRHASKHKNTIWFIAIYFFYSDSYSTIGTLGILFGQTQLCLPIISLGIIALEVVVFAAIGCFMFLKIQKHWKLDAKTMVVMNLSGWVFICIWGCLGLSPDIPIGLKQQWEIFAFAFIHGINLGSVQSFSRSLYADLSEPGEEAKYFAFFEITDKGSSWLGPLVVGIMSQYNIRYSFIYLLVMTLIPAILLWLLVDHRQGMIDVGRLPPDAEGDAKKENVDKV